MLAMIGHANAGAAPDTLQIGQFGTVHVYRPAGAAQRMVIFLSGDGGWRGGVIDMAGKLSAQGALVAGIDTQQYLRGVNGSSVSCAYPGADFERLARLVQQQAGLAEYHYPILVGYAAGASLVYALLNQTATGTFVRS